MQTTLESITDAFCGLDRDWRFTYVNRQAEVLLGRDRDDLIGKNHWEEYPDTLGTDLERAYRRAVAENVTVGSSSTSAARPLVRGPRLPVAGRPVRLFPGRERAEAGRDRLRESEQRFRQLADAMPQIVWTADRTATSTT